MAKKKVVQPTIKEKGVIQNRLKGKYPQMYEVAATQAEKNSMAGLSPGDRKELEKMIGKKLKKLYGGK